MPTDTTLTTWLSLSIAAVEKFAIPVLSLPRAVVTAEVASDMVIFISLVAIVYAV